MSLMIVQHGVLQALAYADVFDAPLHETELLKYLPVPARREDVACALMALHGQVGQANDLYYLAGREEVVELRKKREARSRQLLPHALRFGRFLGALPFVRMVALTGSLAVSNVTSNEDFDYMLVAAHGRVWTVRLLALAVNRVARIFGYTLCPNVVVSETMLAWPLHDLYSARELCQMVPVTGLPVYRQLLKVNAWAADFLPNAFVADPSQVETVQPFRRIRLLLEWLLSGRLGDRFEAWEMHRKIMRFSRQPGFGAETVFTADVCQGNFAAHRQRTQQAFEARWKRLEAAIRLAAEELRVPV